VAEHRQIGFAEGMVSLASQLWCGRCRSGAEASGKTVPPSLMPLCELCAELVACLSLGLCAVSCGQCCSGERLVKAMSLEEWLGLGPYFAAAVSALLPACSLGYIGQHFQEIPTPPDR
jgi:hypothetical protein